MSSTLHVATILSLKNSLMQTESLPPLVPFISWTITLGHFRVILLLTKMTFYIEGVVSIILTLPCLPSAVTSSNSSPILNLISEVLTRLSCLKVYSPPVSEMVTVGLDLLPSFLVTSPTPNAFMNSSKFSLWVSLYLPVHAAILCLVQISTEKFMQLTEVELRCHFDRGESNFDILWQ